MQISCSNWWWWCSSDFLFLAYRSIRWFLIFDNLDFHIIEKNCQNCSIIVFFLKYIEFQPIFWILANKKIQKKIPVLHLEKHFQSCFRMFQGTHMSFILSFKSASLLRQEIVTILVIQNTEIGSFFLHWH